MYVNISTLSCFSRVWLFAAFLSMGFSRQEYQSGLPCPPPGDLPDPGIEPAFLTSPALASGLFTTSTTWEAHVCVCAGCVVCVCVFVGCVWGVVCVCIDNCKVFAKAYMNCPMKWMSWSLQIVENIPQVVNTFSNSFFVTVRASAFWQ